MLYRSSLNYPYWFIYLLTVVQACIIGFESGRGQIHPKYFDKLFFCSDLKEIILKLLWFLSILLNYNRKCYWLVIHLKKRRILLFQQISIMSTRHVTQLSGSFMYETRNILLSSELHGMQFLIHWKKKMPYDMNTIHMYYALCVGSKFILRLRVPNRRMRNVDNY